MVASATMLVETAAAPRTRTPDDLFMELALDAARRGATIGEVPIGAVVVRGERVLGTGHNAPISGHDPTAHAEVIALRAAAQLEENYRLPGTTLYVTVEPCVMCVGALLHARVARVVFGCTDPKGGALGSLYDVGRDGRGNHRLIVRGGVCADGASALLRSFFHVRRGA
jgi:tRNA(adenine34) deaminase